MARNVNTSIVPKVTLHTMVYKKDGTAVEKVMNIEDMVTDLRYAGGGKNNKISGRIADIGFTVAKTKRLYTSVAKAKSWFKYDVLPTTLTVDASTEYHSNLVEIPAKEILEDAGETDIAKITSYLSYGFHCEVLRSDDTTNIFDVEEGDILSDIRYLFRGDETVIPSAKLIAIKRDGTTMKPVTLVLNVDNKLRQIQVAQLVNIGGSGQSINESESIMDSIQADSTDPQTVYVGPGIFNENLKVSGNVTIRGNKVGIWGTSKNRDKESFTDETILSGSISVASGGKLTIDGCVLSGSALITLTEGSDEITVQNCIITGLTGPSTRSSFIAGFYFTDGTKVVVEHCYFGDNVNNASSKIYNLFELNFPLRTGSSISNNYFTKDGICHNFINIYGAMDDAVIDLNDNEFEYSGTAVRIGTRGDAKCTININNIIYHSTDESDDGKWAGMMIIQPYKADTITMEHITININNAKKEDLLQLYCMFSYIKDNYLVLTEENAPLVYVNGTLYPRLFNHILEAL